MSDGAAPLSRTFRFTALDPAAEVCLVASQRDVTGEWTDSAPACDVPEIVEDHDHHGCSSAGAPTGALAWLLSAGMLLMARVRRVQ